jgi:hypothetical protein
MKADGRPAGLVLLAVGGRLATEMATQLPGTQNVGFQ